MPLHLLMEKSIPYKCVKTESRPSTRQVKFEESLVTNIIYRPFTTQEENLDLFYQPEDYLRFKEESEHFQETDEIGPMDSIFIREFNAFTSVFSIILVCVLVFAHALSFLEAYARSNNDRLILDRAPNRLEQKTLLYQFTGLNPTVMKL